MRLLLVALSLWLLAGAGGAVAQQARTYADLEQREVKALSEAEVAELREGQGMGFALAAELNGYPGPLHVLELADKLDLTAEQGQRVEELYASMKRRAMDLGEQVVELEAALDRQFAERSVTAETVESLTGEIGSARARLRAVHLQSHLQMMDVLTAEQVEIYMALRGYRSDDGAGGDDHGGHRRH